jgi:hypothetical protein
MKHRILNKLYANIFGYFWTRCPICGQMFGGHEWKKPPHGKYNAIEYYERDGRGLIVGDAICPDCTKSGEGGMIK